jgi:cytoskeleton protein RodZ
VGSFGERLRREREMRGITLDEIAAATKIGARSLKALEEEDFKKLPGGIFNKGFVRAYAKFLGISEEQAVGDYLAACGEPEDVAEIDPAQLLAQREESEAKSKAASRRARELQSIQTDSSSGFPWMALVGLAIIVALAWGVRVGYYRYRAHLDAQAQAQAQAQHEAEAKAQAEAAAAVAAQQAIQSAVQPQPDAATSPDANSAQPATTPGTSAPKPDTKQLTPDTSQKAPQKATEQKAEIVDPSNSEPPAKAGGFSVLVHARQKIWISIKADGKYLISGELPSSSERKFQPHGQVTLKTGNAGGTDVAVNGKPLPSLGADGEVRTVTINPDGSFEILPPTPVKN